MIELGAVLEVVRLLEDCDVEPTKLLERRVEELGRLLESVVVLVANFELEVVVGTDKLDVGNVW